MRPRPPAPDRRNDMNDDTYFELPAHEVFGPQGAHVVALLERARHLTPELATITRDDR